MWLLNVVFSGEPGARMDENQSRANDALLLDLDESTVGAFAVDGDRRVVAWNAAAETLLGYRADEVIGRRCSDVLGAGKFAASANGHTTCANCPLSGSGRSRRPPTFELHVATREGEGRWISIGTMRASTLGGERRVVHLFRDVTAYHALDGSFARMRKQPAEAGHLVTDVPAYQQAHELPEPLTAREAEALRLLSQGLGTGEIAEALSISRITARNHVTRVMEKLGANSRLQAVVIAAQRGLL